MDTQYQQQQKLFMAQKRVKSIKGFYTHLAVYLIVNIALITVKAFTVESGEDFFNFYQTFSTAFFWGIGVVFHAVGVFGKNAFLGNNWEERKIREIMEKEQHSKTKWE